jgi:pre-rRNA-processing protein TSR4
MSLLLQLNSDLPEYFPNDERRLHIFACKKKQCGQKAGSIRAVREVKRHRREGAPQTRGEGISTDAEPEKQTEDLGATIFGANKPKSSSTNANPFSISSNASPESSHTFAPLPPPSTLAAKSPQPPQEPPTETFASKLRISSVPQSTNGILEESWPPEPAFPKPFTYLHLDAEYESLVPEKAQLDGPLLSSSTQPQYMEEDGTASSGLDKDLFESSLDKTFLKFSDRLAQNPEQVLRYEWKGTPLLYSATDAVGKRLAASNAKTKATVGMPKCESCGAGRVFEMQLVPGAIVALEEEDVNLEEEDVNLEEEDVNLEEGMEWGTIIVGVCERNCGEVGQVVFKEEWCGVQWEERG